MSIAVFGNTMENSRVVLEPQAKCLEGGIAFAMSAGSNQRARRSDSNGTGNIEVRKWPAIPLHDVRRRSIGSWHLTNGKPVD